MRESHDELLEVNLPVAIIVKDVNHPPGWRSYFLLNQGPVQSHLTRGFCCNSGKDINSSMEREPDPSRSFFVQFNKYSTFTTLAIPIPEYACPDSRSSGNIVKFICLHITRDRGKSKAVVFGWFCWCQNWCWPVFWSACPVCESHPRQTLCSSLAGLTRSPSLTNCLQLEVFYYYW